MRGSRLLVTLPILVLSAMAGCGALTAPDSESAARSHLDKEFQKWIAGEASSVSMIEAIGAVPISYRVKSVVKDKPDSLSFNTEGDLPKGWENWPAYKFNVVAEFKSQAGTPLDKVATYTLTWNAQEKKWYARERF